MKVHDLSNADKYLLLGNLLKKISSDEASDKALEIVKSSASLEEKLTAVLKLYQSSRSPDTRSRNEKPSFPGTGDSSAKSGKSPRSSAHVVRSKRSKPRVLIMDPRSEISRVLSSSQLADSYAFIHTGRITGQADHVRRYRPRAVILNAEEEISTTLELSRMLAENQNDVSVIILCTKSQYKEAVKDDYGRENTHLISKPLNLMRLADVLQQAAMPQ
jgi:hypothetical protein